MGEGFLLEPSVLFSPLPRRGRGVEGEGFPSHTVLIKLENTVWDEYF